MYILNNLPTPTRTHTYHQLAMQGMAKRPIIRLRCFQLGMAQDSSTNTHASIGQDGKPMTQDRHLGRVNSVRRLYCMVTKKPHPSPMKKRQTANITQDVEKAATMLLILIISRDRKNGFFLPRMSAIWPATMLDKRTPAV